MMQCNVMLRALELDRVSQWLMKAGISDTHPTPTQFLAQHSTTISVNLTLHCTFNVCLHCIALWYLWYPPTPNFPPLSLDHISIFAPFLAHFTHCIASVPCSPLDFYIGQFLPPVQLAASDSSFISPLSSVSFPTYWLHFLIASLKDSSSAWK